MTATVLPPSVPTMSSPEWPGAVLRSKPGVSAYGIRVDPATSSARRPRPDPRTIPTDGIALVFERIAATAAGASSAIRAAAPLRRPVRFLEDLLPQQRQERTHRARADEPSD